MFSAYFKGVFKQRRKRRLQPNALHYKKHKELARSVIVPRVVYFATMYNISYGRIAIRNSRRSWGSCSSKGNLNFHYRLLFVPETLRDYVIVHELCHRRFFNHSKEFWSEVEMILPDYIERRSALKEYEAKRTFKIIIDKSESK
jgi:predicted metal-dependent hydrolase